MPLSIVGIANQLVTICAAICAAICNLLPSLAKCKEKYVCFGDLRMPLRLLIIKISA